MENIAKMPKKRILYAGLATLALVASAAAQMSGPVPLAWRWYQPTSVAPSGSPLVSGDTIYFSSGNRVYSIDRNTGTCDCETAPSDLRWAALEGLKFDDDE